ncbi:MAG: nitrite/sulfite reductase, partial [Nitrosopumilaceae archaeon]|nr:nitrite/sulfite reductase [Nitrosopumilaceae archaeon]NIU00086.1 nitrite/sulfite reductase [Nitrosopumilaceae archaeon]NIU86472.1 nitrite/sulfite reductase [Nitrosopumilaceae archaeon]NIV65640.1 nitrite/sulfite reductase [Nitrosopumilaceae archaeon]NIX60688.1 nitrite/sulfite reductase [Nitrosopumilaceae archaeon]
DLKTWIHRIVQGKDDSEITSLNDLKKTLSPLTVPPTKEEDPEFYTDYGSDTSYHTKTGKGECAA